VSPAGGAAQAARPSSAEGACAPCLRRAWLVCALAGYLERARHGASGLCDLLALSDEELSDIPRPARARELRRQLESLDPAGQRDRIQSAGLEGLCRHDGRYPAPLRDRADAPAVLHVAAGSHALHGLLGGPLVAIVGARRASDYGREVAGSIARGLGAAGVTVISGMAAGIDSAAHGGALAGGGQTVAVLAGGADVAYPASARSLYRRIVTRGAVISEMPPGFRAYRWGFVARNRIIAALGCCVVVVEAAEHSGSLVTASMAEVSGTTVAAVPGRVTSPLAHGPHGLLRAGATLVRDAGDVLDLLYEGEAARPEARPEPELEPRLKGVLDAVRAGQDSAAALSQAGLDAPALLAALSELELLGRLRRGTDGRYTVVA